MSEPKPLPKDFLPNFVTVDYAKTWGEEYKDWFTKADLQSAGSGWGGQGRHEHRPIAILNGLVYNGEGKKSWCSLLRKGVGVAYNHIQWSCRWFFLSIFFLLPGLGSWVGAEKKEKPRKKRAGFHNLNEDATIFGSSIFLSKTKRWQSR